jgi:nitroreductase
LGHLTAEFQVQQGMTDPAKLDKTRGKFTRAAAMVMVASESQPHANLATQVEDRDATAAAVQNLLLAATSLGLATYWGSGPVCEAPSVKAWCGFAAHAQVVAAIYLGYPFGDVPVPFRTVPTISWLGDSTQQADS